MSAGDQSLRGSDGYRMVLRTVLSLVIVVGVLVALLFVPAGRLDWPEAWAFVASYTALLVAYAVWGLAKDPRLFQERSRMGRNTKTWDKAILAIYTALLLLTLVLTGLDAGRYRWSVVPLAARVAAWLGLVGSGGLILAAVIANTYLSRTARIQSDRGQVVITRGPYAVVRHPMYLGVILLFACLPPALGSLWAMIPGLSVAGLFVLRTAKEDRMLRDELAGYSAYCGRVRYRLLPGVW